MKIDHQSGAAVQTAHSEREEAMPVAHPTPEAMPTNLAGGRPIVDRVGKALWHVPGRFNLARMAGPQYALRSVIFHDVSDTQSSFTRGLGVTTTPKTLERALAFLIRHYIPVSLQNVLDQSPDHPLPVRPVLVTFDDAYASVAEIAAPLCHKYNVPAVFFVNAAFLDNQRLALDNLVCHAANQLGMDAIRSAAEAAYRSASFEMQSIRDVFTHFLPAVSLQVRTAFRDSLFQMAGTSERNLAAEAGLYLTSDQLRYLDAFNFEIGNHTYSHLNCRALPEKDFGAEISRNQLILEKLSGRPVRSFSVPYGSADDMTPELAAYLKSVGHQTIFLAESCSNPHHDKFRLDRVTVQSDSDAGFFSEIEVLPRMRTVRNRLFAARRTRVN